MSKRPQKTSRLEELANARAAWHRAPSGYANPSRAGSHATISTHDVCVSSGLMSADLPYVHALMRQTMAG